MKHIVELIKIFVIAGIVIFSAGIIHAQTVWTGPTATPPNNNVAAPINVSTVTQEKMGIFGSHGFFSLGSGWFSTSTRPTWPPVINGQARLTLAVNGSVGAKEYCDDNGQNCVTTLGGGFGGRGGSGENGQDGTFGAPNYDSGWIDYGTNGNPTKKKFVHNFGASDYIVEVVGKGDTTPAINCSTVPANSENSFFIDSSYTFYYDKLPNSISIQNYTNSTASCARYLRLRLWKTSAGTIAPASSVIQI